MTKCLNCEKLEKELHAACRHISEGENMVLELESEIEVLKEEKQELIAWLEERKKLVEESKELVLFRCGEYELLSDYRKGRLEELAAVLEKVMKQ